MIPRSLTQTFANMPVHSPLLFEGNGLSLYAVRFSPARPEHMSVEEEEPAPISPKIKTDDNEPDELPRPDTPVVSSSYDCRPFARTSSSGAAAFTPLDSIREAYSRAGYNPEGYDPSSPVYDSEGDKQSSPVYSDRSPSPPPLVFLTKSIILDPSNAGKPVRTVPAVNACAVKKTSQVGKKTRKVVTKKSVCQCPPQDQPPPTIAARPHQEHSLLCEEDDLDSILERPSCSNPPSSAA